ncbi:MAG: hypothetical protein CVT49_10315 [candidate division Zixibacteria bacterium HGW-Zixibacteria-1]|nr:MAG: hypothetical protein CVT49_10315 [candidate division Zixibacteria bacterium HGW-Zixibacteria-1]
MKKRTFFILLLSLLMPTLAKTSPPSLPERNFDITFEVTDEPKMVGDIINVKWSFKLGYEKDSILKSFYEQQDTTRIVKAYLHIAGPLEYISGDTLWWGIVDYNKTYSFTASFRVVQNAIVGIRPIVETHFELFKKSLKTKNSVRGCVYDLRPQQGAAESMFIPKSEDSVVDAVCDKIPDYIVSIDNNNPRIPLLNNLKIQFPKTISINVDTVQYNDTLHIRYPMDSTLKILFDKVDSAGIDLIYDDKLHIKESDSSFIIMTTDEVDNTIIKVIISRRGAFYIKMIGLWKLDGYFKYDDAFGNGPFVLNGVDCFLYKWTGSQWEQEEVARSYPDGYFVFYTDADTVATIAYSANEFAHVFYAKDSCFNFSLGETYGNHGWMIITCNPYHIDHTIPDSYTTVYNLNIAAAFHLLDIVRFSNISIAWPNFSTPYIPIYFLDCDNCFDNSSYGSYTMGNIKGIKIKGSESGVSDDWDQWDTSVVLHEMGHFFHDDFAERAPNCGGTHTFTGPTTEVNKDDLQVAWREGWATFFAGFVMESSVQLNYAYPIPDTLYWLNLERPKPDVPYYLYIDQVSQSSPYPLYEGDHVEGSVALSLWDLLDLVDDGNYYVGGNIWGHNNDYNSADWWNGWDPIFDVFTNFDPQPDNPDHNYCWNIHEFVHGWRTFGYPVDSTFKNIFEAHNVPVFKPGDANDNELINILDATFIIDYLYKSGAAPPHMSAADINADCSVNILDATYLIDYLYKGGSAPLAGCYNYYPN